MVGSGWPCCFRILRRTGDVPGVTSAALVHGKPALVAVMGWNNPPVPWKHLERSLSGTVGSGDGGDSPAWGRRREKYLRPTYLPLPRSDDNAGAATRVPYAELHCHSNFSF